MRLPNREIHYADFADYVEHVTGKKVRSIERSYSRRGMMILFEDDWMTFVGEAEALDPNNIRYERPYGYFCVSCGERSHGACEYDHRGWCTTTAKNFYEKVRKLYWHRYLKNKA